jgi:hypothetical protein
MDTSPIDQLDVRMREFSSRLRDDLRISPPESNNLATAIRREVQELGPENRPIPDSGSPLSLTDRIGLLNAFLVWWATESGRPGNVGQIMALNYMCFVYLGESHFKKLRKWPPGSLCRKCGTFLTDNPVRAFRNALAHGNWRGSFDNQGIDFWARKGEDSTEPLERFRVAVADLNFWHSLAITTAYASLIAL